MTYNTVTTGWDSYGNGISCTKKEAISNEIASSTYEKTYYLTFHLTYANKFAKVK